MPGDSLDDLDGGWSTETESISVSTDNDDDNHPSKPEKSQYEPRNSLSGGSEEAPSADEYLPCPPPNLLNVLCRILNMGSGLPEHLSFAPLLFPNLSRYICGHQSMIKWLSSRQNDCFVLRAPDGLQNPMFFNCIQACLKSTSPYPQIATAVLGNDNETRRNHGEYLLASLCYQLLLDNANFEDASQHIIKDINAAFRGYNYSWRETMLWLLLQTFLTSGPNKPRVCFVTLSLDLGAAPVQRCVSILDRLLAFIKAIDRNTKLLVTFGAGHTADLSTPYSMTVDLEDAKTRKMLLADFESALKDVAQSRPCLKAPELQEVVLSNLSQQIHQPSVANSYIRTLRTRAWISKAQLRADSDLLRSPEFFISSSILDRIPHPDRPLIADLLGFISRCGRPMTTTELRAALTIARLSVDSDQARENLLLDLDNVALHLSGLIHIENNRVWHLEPSWTQIRDAIQKSNFKDPDNSDSGTALPTDISWLHTGPVAGMKLAYVCLKYLSLYAHRKSQSAPIDHDNLIKQWPLLEYAVMFWNDHYSLALREGATDDELRQLIIHMPEVLQSWLVLQDYFGLRTHTFDEVQYVVPSATIISAKFACDFSEAVSIANVTARLVSAMNNDEYSATVWSAWLHLNHSNEPALSWLQKTKSVPDPCSLMKAFSYAPEPTFQLLLVNQEFIQRNARAISEEAIQQGAESIAEHCLSQLSSDEKVISALPLASCIRRGYMPIVQKMLTRFNCSQAIFEGQMARILLHESVRYGHIEILDLAFSGKFNVDLVAHYDEILLFASQTGRYESLQHVIGTRRAVAARIYKEAADSPLHCASSHDFLRILNALISQGVAIGAQVRNGDTALHVAARSGHIGIVESLVKAARKDVTSTSAIITTEVSTVSVGQDHPPEDDTGGNIFLLENHLHRIPLEEAIINGHDEITSLILGMTPKEFLMKRKLLHTAAQSKHLGVLKSILDFEGINFDKNERDDSGKTPLHIACLEGAVDIVQELISRGADVWTPDDDEVRPIDSLNDTDESSRSRIAQMIYDQAPEDERLGSLLVRMAHIGEGTTVTKLLDAGAEKDYKMENGRTPLHAAAYNGHEDIVRTLLLRRVDLNRIDSWGDSPIKDAAASDFPGIVKLLLDAGAQTNIEGDTEMSDGTSFQNSLLHWAAKSEKLEIVKLLLEKGERFPLEGADCPLETLTEARLTSMLECIIEHQKDLESSTVLGKCFHIALRNEDIDTLSLLLEKEVNPNAGSAERFGTALHECAFYGNTRMTDWLLQHPGVFSIKHEVCPYYTPLIAAVARPYPPEWQADPMQRKAGRRLDRQKKMIKYLREHSEDHNGDITAKGGILGTMLNAAAARGSTALFEYVLDEVGFEAMLVDQEERSAAHMVCTASAYAKEKLELLVARNGEDILRSRDVHGRTPLHLACGNGSSALSYLLEIESVREDLDSPDRDGWTPLHWACRHWDPEVVQQLVANDAKISWRTKNGWTAWNVAVSHGNGKASFLKRLLEADADTPSMVPEGFKHSATCGSCFVEIWGTRYTCEQCQIFDLCFKCYKCSKSFHNEDHTFEETGDMVTDPDEAMDVCDDTE